MDLYCATTLGFVAYDICFLQNQLQKCKLFKISAFFFISSEVEVTLISQDKSLSLFQGRFEARLNGSNIVGRNMTRMNSTIKHGGRC